MNLKFFILLIFATTTLLLGADISEIFVPYNENGFYVGSIIILLIIYVGIPLLVLFIIGGVIAYFIFPKILDEFRLLITLYYEGELVKGLKRHFWHFSLFTIFVLIFIMILQMFHLSYLYLFITLIFCYSSFFGFYTLLYTLMAFYYKNIQKVVLGLFLGAGIFFFFAPSAYYLFLPIYNFFNGTEKIEKNSEYTKNIKNPVDIFTSPNITSNMSAGEKERVERYKELEKTKSYNYYLNMKPSPEVRQVKMVSYYEDFLTVKSLYEFTYFATPKYFEFLAKHDKYPKSDPKNVPVHKVSCSDYHKSKIGDECYFGVLYPYFHNIIYTPKTEEVKHSVGYYCW